MLLVKKTCIRRKKRQNTRGGKNVHLSETSLVKSSKKTSECKSIKLYYTDIYLDAHFNIYSYFYSHTYTDLYLDRYLNVFSPAYTDAFIDGLTDARRFPM